MKKESWDKILVPKGVNIAGLTTYLQRDLLTRLISGCLLGTRILGGLHHSHY